MDAHIFLSGHAKMLDPTYGHNLNTSRAARNVLA